MTHLIGGGGSGFTIDNFGFVPYEDVVGVGHGKGKWNKRSNAIHLLLYKIGTKIIFRFLHENISFFLFFFLDVAQLEQ